MKYLKILSNLSVKIAENMRFILQLLFISALLYPLVFLYVTSFKFLLHIEVSKELFSVFRRIVYEEGEGTSLRFW